MVSISATVISVLTALVASSGFWTFIVTRKEKKSASTRLLMGLAHDKILHLGMKHIEAGVITKDQYEDLRDYLYAPYLEAGGNGTVERVMAEVSKLPLVPHRVEIVTEDELKLVSKKGYYARFSNKD